MSAILMAAAMAVSTPAPAPAHTEVPPPPLPPPPASAPAAPAASAPPPPAASDATVHPVAPGESLSWIAKCELGNGGRWVEVLELNRDKIVDPDVIEPGWQLTLPEPGTGDCPPPPPATKVAASSASSSSAGASASSSRSSSDASSATAPRRARQASSQGGGNLASIRQCESGGDYGAVSSSGKYRGAYQFDQQTWESVGGSGDPAAASAAEQDQRASALAQQRGSSPWPNCG